MGTDDDKTQENAKKLKYLFDIMLKNLADMAKQHNLPITTKNIIITNATDMTEKIKTTLIMSVKRTPSGEYCKGLYAVDRTTHAVRESIDVSELAPLLKKIKI